MNKSELKLLGLKIKALSVFRSLVKDAVISSLLAYIDNISDNNQETAVYSYAEFVSKLYHSRHESLGGYVRSIVSNDENCYINAVGRNKEPSDVIKESVKREIAVLQQIASLTSKELLEPISEYSSILPEFEIKNIDLLEDYKHRCENIGKYGYGIYAKYHMFYVEQAGNIVPVRYPDNTRLCELIDYEREKNVIIENTKALLTGKPAANILLTGDAGTGKSSTIKAVVNEFYTEGLRILEIRKDQLMEIPAILDELSENPLKFIIFIDDLSFQKGDDNFSALKAILEGSVSAKAKNVVIYATSNRRHLVKESFSDRDGDDIHRNDTMQEMLSLSERFGIHITFNKPDKKTYLNIVHHLAKDKGVEIGEAELDLLAERYALERGGRSARAAKQLIDGLLSK
ncbi:MAG: ATP-binding protein [Clostridia bacterium]|nr:ATP-binding protein [Clostridia bacterium]